MYFEESTKHSVGFLVTKSQIIVFSTSLSNNLRTFFSLLSMNETTLTPLISTLTSPVSWLLLLYCNAPSYGTVALWSSFYTSSTLYFPSILAVTSLGERLYQEHWNRKEKSVWISDMENIFSVLIINRFNPNLIQTWMNVFSNPSLRKSQNSSNLKNPNPPRLDYSTRKDLKVLDSYKSFLAFCHFLK